MQREQREREGWRRAGAAAPAPLLALSVGVARVASFLSKCPDVCVLRCIMDVCVCVCVSVCMDIYIYIYIYIHMDIYETYIHTLI